ncbi:ABC transporter substrate-binding protein [Synechococcus elongatus]|uniref:ABC transporter substrate-binding protein n=1 Tax=Synechococcus elongatus TaxID=32046 RepID=UPI0030CCB56E
MGQTAKTPKFNLPTVVISVGILLTSAVAFVWFEKSKSKSSLEQSQTAALTAVPIGYSRLSISLPVFIAQDKGFFKKNGIKAELQQYDDGGLLGQALAEGKIDVGGYSASPILFNGSLRTGRQFFYVTTQVEDDQHRVSYLLRPKTPPGQQPEIKTIADLKGKRVGILPTAAYKLTLEALLRQNQVDPKTVIIQQVEPSLQPQLLKSGGIDALYTVTPPGVAAIATGAGELIGNNSPAPELFGKPFPFSQFVISKEWANKNPDLTKRLVKSLDEAINYINANPTEAKESYRNYLAEVHHKFIDQYPQPKYLTSYDNKKDEILIKIADEYLKVGITPKKIDLSNSIYRGQPLGGTTSGNK